MVRLKPFCFHRSLWNYSRWHCKTNRQSLCNTVCFSKLLD